MSDPVTNVEIEDVLSSIRRLVSESGGQSDARRDETQESAEAEPAAETAPEDQDAAPEPVGKLVLTPALRISDAEDAAQDDSQVISEISAAETVEPETEDAPQVEAETAAAETVEPETEDAPEVEAETAADAAAEGPTADAKPEDTPDEPAPETGAEAAGEALKSRIEALEHAVSEQEGEWEGEGDAEEDITEALNWEDHIADEDMTAPQVPPFVAGAAFDVTPEAPEAEADSETDSGAETEGVTESDEPFDFMGDDTVLDEEALREMVSEIVRQELQGALGERITRNVRKLVRREIHRVLMSQELD